MHLLLKITGCFTKSKLQLIVVILIMFSWIIGCDLLFPPEPEANLKFIEYSITSDPNDDGIISPGETIGFSISFKNSGDTTAYDIEIQASCNSNYVEFIDAAESYYSLKGGYKHDLSSSSDFKFKVNSNAKAGTNFSIDLIATTSTGDGFKNTIDLTIEKPDIILQLNDYMIRGDDGMISPGESASIYYSLLNIGITRASRVISSATTNDENVESISGNIDDYFGTIYGDSSTGYCYFYLTVSSSAAINAEIPILFTIRDDNNYTWVDTLIIFINKGSLVEFLSYEIDDATGNGDGIINPGESISLKVNIKNSGILPAHGVTGNIYSDDQNVNITENTSNSFEDIEPGKEATSGFNFQFLVYATHEATPIEFRIKLNDSLSNSWTSYFSIPVN